MLLLGHVLTVAIDVGSVQGERFGNAGRISEAGMGAPSSSGAVLSGICSVSVLPPRSTAQLADHHACGAWCLHVWEVVGVWATGLATFLSVVVSLSLARRAGVRLTVSARAMALVGAGPGQYPFTGVVLIKVKNVGGRPATIEGVGWQRRPWGNQYAYQIFDPARFPGPPVTIEPGNAHTFQLPLDDPKFPWTEWMLKHFVGRWPQVGVRLVRVTAYTPTGDHCYAFLDTGLRRWLLAKTRARLPRSSPIPGER